MPERLNFEQLQVVNEREILENQPPELLRALKVDALSKMSELEALVHHINDVMDGAGYTRYHEGEAYDANDDTIGSTERQEQYWPSVRTRIESV